MPALSLQLYSARNFQPFSDIFAKLAAAGYEEVEGYGALYAQLDQSSLISLRNELNNHGLKMMTGHFGLEMQENAPDRVLEIADCLGIKAIYSPFLLPERRPSDAQGWAAFGRHLADVQKPFREAGITAGWHNHEFEFAALSDGSMPIQHILAGNDAIAWEADIAWIARTGLNVFEQLEKYAPRIQAVHVKDAAPAGENLDEDGWTAVGHGILPWPEYLRNLKQAPVRHYVIEHDNPKDIDKLIIQSKLSVDGFF